MIQYLEDAFANAEIESKTVPVKRKGILQLAPGQNPEGYGQKISTDYMIRLDGQTWHRVYATCWSNAASHWVTINKQKYHFRNPDNLKINGPWPS